MKFGANECCQTSQCFENKACKLDEYFENHGSDLEKLDNEHREIFYEGPETAIQADKHARKADVRLQIYSQKYEHHQGKGSG